MPLNELEGVIPILLTPFDDKGRIDEESLAALVDHTIEAGVHGLGVALGSEIFKLTEDERATLTKAVIAAVGGRVPVIINSGAAGTDLAVHYGRLARDAGADALMIIPPTFFPATSEEIADYYRTIDRAVGLPIVIQDVFQGPVPAGLALRIADECENVRFIKVESLPIVPKVEAMVAAAGGRLTVIGGAGGSYFIEEMRRGARGTMPFPSQAGAFVAVWNLFRAGNEAEARRVFDSTIMAVNRIAQQSGDLFYHVHKQLLVRLGVIATSTVRGPTTAVDPITQREIDTIFETVIPAMRAVPGSG